MIVVLISPIGASFSESVGNVVESAEIVSEVKVSIGLPLEIDKLSPIIPFGVIKLFSGIWARLVTENKAAKNKTMYRINRVSAGSKLCTSLFRFSEKFTILRKVIAFMINNRNIVKNIAIFSSLVAITLLFFFNPVYSQEYEKINTVVIDAGHGGKDPGTHGATTKEKNLVLDVALKVGKYIEENVEGVKVIYTRKDDRFLELYERAKIANDSKADLFISIHANALPGKESVYGTETYVMGLHTNDLNFNVAKRENSVILMEEDHEEKYEGFDPNSPESYIMFSLTQNAYLENSLLMANYVEEQFDKRVGRKSRGVRQAGFQVLWNTYMPSVLVEIGYLTNQKEERELNTEQVKEYIASGIYRAFKEYKNQMESIN